VDLGGNQKAGKNSCGGAGSGGEGSSWGKGLTRTSCKGTYTVEKGGKTHVITIFVKTSLGRGYEREKKGSIHEGETNQKNKGRE